MKRTAQKVIIGVERRPRFDDPRIFQGLGSMDLVSGGARASNPSPGTSGSCRTPLSVMVVHDGDVLMHLIMSMLSSITD